MQAYNMTDRVRQEVSIHSRLKHPSILQLYTFFEDANYVYLVLELAHNGEFYQYLKETQKILSENETATVMQQVIAGILYLHSHNILHRDISLSNLLLTKSMQVKISDFGLATQLSSHDGNIHKSLCGTPNYISPEIASRSADGLPTDVWSLGCMLYTLLIGRPPFETNGVKSTLTQVVMGSFVIPDSLSSQAKDLIKKMLNKNPSKRIALQDVVTHPFLQKSQQQYTVTSNDSGIVTILSCGLSKYSPQQFRSRSETQIDYETIGSASLYQKFNSLENGVHPLHHSEDASIVKKQVDFYNPSPVLASRSEGIFGNLARDRDKMNLVPTKSTSFEASVNQFQTPVRNGNRLKEDPPWSTSSLTSESNRIGVPPLTTDRLQLTRHKTKNAILSILKGGEVVIEFTKYKPRYNQERIQDVFRISSDGLRIVLYQPNSGKGVSVQSEPIDMPANGVDQIFSYENLPSRHWKKYLYAFRFVEMVKAKTPKITFYSDQAKCQLMENSEDFEANFYDGTKLTKNKTEVRLLAESGTEINVNGNFLDNIFKNKLQHGEMTFSHCCNIEKTMSKVSLSLPCFPIIIGRRPQASKEKETVTSQRTKKHNYNNYLSSSQTPIQQPNILMPSYSYTSSNLEESMKTSPLGVHQQNVPKPTTEFTKKVFIPQIGHVIHYTNGVVQIFYLDDTQITVLTPSQGNGILFTPSGFHSEPIHYNENDNMPELVKYKFKQIPNVLKQLMTSNDAQNVLITSTPATNRLKLNYMKYIR